MDEDSIEDMIDIANELQLTEVTDDCLKFLQGCLGLDNWYNIWNIAKKYRKETLQEVTLSFAINEFVEVSHFYD